MRHWSNGLRLAPEAMGIHPLLASGARATRSARSCLAALAQLQHHYGMFCKAEMLSRPGRFETHRLHTVRARRAFLREDEGDPWVTVILPKSAHDISVCFFTFKAEKKHCKAL